MNLKVYIFAVFLIFPLFFVCGCLDEDPEAGGGWSGHEEALPPQGENKEYCLLFAEQFQDTPCPCFQYWLTYTNDPDAFAFIDYQGTCRLNERGKMAGWELFSTDPLTFEEGDAYITRFSPYFNDEFDCNGCLRGDWVPGEGPVFTSTPRERYPEQIDVSPEEGSGYEGSFDSESNGGGTIGGLYDKYFFEPISR